jgi:hypothetical protein
VLGWDQPYTELVDYQCEMARMVALHKIAIFPAGNIIGKSRLLGGLLIPWWLTTRPFSQVVALAPSQHLVGSVLWKELRKAHRTSRYPLGGTVSHSIKVSPQSWEIADGWSAVGYSTTSVERASGQHNPQLLAIIDEASAISDEIWEALWSWGATKYVIAGNPLRATGEFPRIFARSRHPDEVLLPVAERTVSKVISSTDSPDIHLTKSPRGLADKSFLNQIEKFYGRDSLYWKLHVELSKDSPFPISDYEQLIATEWLDRCVNVPRRGGGRRALAMDVAKGTGKDRTVIIVGDVYGIHHVWQSNTTSIQDAARMVRQFAEMYGVPAHQVVYDAGGAFGTDAERYLQAVGYGQARKYYGNDSGGPRFKNKRSWASWQLRVRLDPDRPAAKPYTPSDPTMPLLGHGMFIHPTPVPQAPFSIPVSSHWSELREELIGLRYGYDGSKMALEKKDAYAIRLGRSPDLCDSLLMLMSVLYGEPEL